MKWGVEFWLRVAIAAGFAAIIIAAPSVLFPFVVSLIITTLLNPVAHAVYGQTQKMGWTRFPYDFAILFSFALFIAVIYLIGVHIFVPFVSEFQEFIKSVPGMLAAVQQAIPELEKQYQLSLMPPEAKSLFARILQDIGEYTLKIASFSLSAIFSFASTVVELIVVPFITFYMMKRGGYFVNAFIHIFPDRFHHHLEELFKEIHFVLNARSEERRVGKE
ncbi:AI-2E family transporter, partial [uncultured Dialister sp.]|uniref:AI-2E family transporter n=1 Tax=uncultured Dialister sp. TaxID=278064 RepID=UPI002594D81E